MSIPLYKPFIKRIDMDAVLNCLVSGLQSTEPQWKSLVHECLPIINALQGVGIREHRRAVELACKIAHIPEQGVIVTSPLTSHATISVLRDCGFNVVFIDCETHVPTLQIDEVLRAIEKESPDALWVEDHVGYVSNSLVGKIGSLPIIEDMSQAFGHHGAGSIGTVVLLDMEPEGIITSGGGTLVFVKEKKSAQKLQEIVNEIEVTSLMPDMNAVLGKTQLSDAKYYIETRKGLSEIFHRAVLRGHHQVIAHADGESAPFYSVNVICKTGAQEVIAYARKQQVETQLTFAKSEIAFMDDEFARQFPNAQSLALRCVSFPLYPSLRKKDVELLERVLVTLP